MTELLAPIRVALGGTRAMMVDRTLPGRERRMVGAWCFLDHYGPEDVSMRVPPHPHTGLQTVSWLFAGEVRHRDSLGNDQLIRPGQLNLMTAGQGIAHAEDSPEDRSGVLHGVQLWVALPDADRKTDPDFAHHAGLPVTSGDGLALTVFVGELAGAASPARAYSPLTGAEAVLAAGARALLPLELRRPRPRRDPRRPYRLDGGTTLRRGTRLPGRSAAGPGDAGDQAQGTRAAAVASIDAAYRALAVCLDTDRDGRLLPR
jgi:redox-sensitive bicupin YhaK (pirin superfamily)